jgi:23S rRNA pseudouridine1911/1915/1917 synthase
MAKICAIIECFRSVQKNKTKNIYNFIKGNKIRLDIYLKEKINSSRNQITNLIKSGFVKVNNKTITKPSFKVSENDKIEYEIQTLEENKEYEVNFDVEIIYEDDEILVVNKPPHLVVHPAPSVKEATLVDWLKAKNIRLSTISGEERHGIVHRIDKETSGALVIAKTNKAHQFLSEQLSNKSMGRYYLAIIDTPLKEDIEIDKPIGRNPKNRLKNCILTNGKTAKTRFIKLCEDTEELIACKLFTGRTHQIRVHLNSINRHIIGDELYGAKESNERIMLHAYILYLIHPKTKKLMQFTAPLFEDMKEKINKICKEEKNEKLNENYIIDRFNNFTNYRLYS